MTFIQVYRARKEQEFEIQTQIMSDSETSAFRRHITFYLTAIFLKAPVYHLLETLNAALIYLFIFIFYYFLNGLNPGPCAY